MAGDIVGCRARSASELQETHSVRGLEQTIVGLVRLRERQARKHAGAVVVVLAPIRPEHVVVGAILVVVLEEIVRLRRPFDQLAPLELVQLMTDLARVLGMRGEQEQDVVEQVVGHERAGDDRPRPEKHRNSIHALLL